MTESALTKPPATPAASREEIDRLIGAGQHAAARAMLGMLWRGAPSPAAGSFVVSRFEKLRGHVPLACSRVFIARSFTAEPAVPLLRAAGFVVGICLEVKFGDFNQYPQEFLDPASALYAFEPNVVILAAQ